VDGCRNDAYGHVYLYAWACAFTSPPYPSGHFRAATQKDACDAITTGVELCCAATLPTTAIRSAVDANASAYGVAYLFCLLPWTTTSSVMTFHHPTATQALQGGH